MPQQHGAVFGSRRDVAVGGDVALRATHARHHAVVTEDYLYYFSWKNNYMRVRKDIYQKVCSTRDTSENDQVARN